MPHTGRELLLFLNLIFIKKDPIFPVASTDIDRYRLKWCVGATSHYCILQPLYLISTRYWLPDGYLMSKHLMLDTHLGAISSPQLISSDPLLIQSNSTAWLRYRYYRTHRLQARTLVLLAIVRTDSLLLWHGLLDWNILWALHGHPTRVNGANWGGGRIYTVSHTHTHLD